MTKLKTRVISGTLQPRKCPHPQPHIPTPKKWDKNKSYYYNSEDF